MNLTQRKAAFAKLGARIAQLTDEDIELLTAQAGSRNNWFDFANVKSALTGIAHMLTEDALSDWLSNYTPQAAEPKKVGVVMAGNIPAVGFHDMLAVLIAGHTLVAKLSSTDPYLINWLATQLTEIEPEFTNRIKFVDKLKDIDAVIATGSDNTSRYFEYYFRNMPHIIRKNRNSVAVLTGFEKEEELVALGEDIFRFYGLGCRNVSKLYVPEEYDFTTLFQAMQPWEKVLDHHKYRNNYDYNKSIYLVNREPHLDNGFMLIRESEQMVSPISVVFYEHYTDFDSLRKTLAEQSEKTQCVVSAAGWLAGSENLGAAQKPQVWQYADDIDTLEFLTVLE